MFEFIRVQYILGRIDEAKVMSYVPKWLDSEQADEILNIV